MGFVGGGGNIAIVSAILRLIELRLRFPDVETNRGPGRPVAASCRILCSNVRGLSGNLSDLAVASSQ